jgi:hypothetical protein
MYEIASGEIRCLDPVTGSFRSLLAHPASAIETPFEGQLVA